MGRSLPSRGRGRARGSLLGAASCAASHERGSGRRDRGAAAPADDRSGDQRAARDAALDRLGGAAADRARETQPARAARAANRYQRERPGELVHIDVKKLGRIDRVGHRISGNDASAAPAAAGADAALDRLGVRPRLRRRRHPPGLRRGAGRRERPHRRRLSPPRGRVLRRARHPRRTRHDRQRLRLPLDPARPRLPRPRPPPPPHPALPATHQRQSRTLHPHDARRLGLRRDLRHLSRTHTSPPRLARPLQSPPRLHHSLSMAPGYNAIREFAKLGAPRVAFAEKNAASVTLSHWSLGNGASGVPPTSTAPGTIVHPADS